MPPETMTVILSGAALIFAGMIGFVWFAAKQSLKK